MTRPATNETLDPRTCCFACFAGIIKPDNTTVPVRTLVPAAYLMPRYRDGNDDEPAEWTPACAEHAMGWWYDMPMAERLPKIDLARAVRLGACNKRKVR